MARGLAGEALLDSYDAERRPVGRLVVRFTDRAFSVATSANPVVRTLRTSLVPRVLPLVLRSRRGAGYGFCVISQLGIGYRRSPAVREGRPRLRRGPRAGDRLPDAHITRDGQRCWLGEALVAPRLHLLLCGPVSGWDAGQLSVLGDRHRDLLAVHHLTREAGAGVLQDPDGVALARLGVRRTGHYLVRPDGHIAYRAADTDLRGLGRWLAGWLPGGGLGRPAGASDCW